MATLPIRVRPNFRIIAHRGASAYAPENTLAAFRLAERMGAREVELDVQLSRDGHLVIVHDEKLTRYGYPELRVADLTLAALGSLDMGSWFSPHLYAGENLLAFETLLDIFGKRFFYHVEIKPQSAEIAPRLLEMLGRYGLEQQTIITSFHFANLAQVRTVCPAQPVGWLLKTGLFIPQNVECAAEAGFYQICPSAADVTPENVAAVHQRFTEVRAFGVNCLADVQRVIESGCDGMTINWPDWLEHEPGL